MRLTHGLLDAMRIGIDDDRGTFSERKRHPSALEDMRYREESDDSVVLSEVHALVVRLQSSMILAVSEHDALACT